MAVSAQEQLARIKLVQPERLNPRADLFSLTCAIPHAWRSSVASVANRKGLIVNGDSQGALAGGALFQAIRELVERREAVSA